jgi:hypothetical protein
VDKTVHIFWNLSKERAGLVFAGISVGPPYILVKGN